MDGDDNRSPWPGSRYRRERWFSVRSEGLRWPG